MVFNWGKKNKDSKAKTKLGEADKKPVSPIATPEAISDPQAPKPDIAQDKPDGFVENAVAMATGLSLVDAHYPGHDPIDYYGNGGFRFGDYSHQGSLMFLPSGTRRWDISSASELTEEAFAQVFEEAGNIEILLIGSGDRLVPLDPALKAKFREAGIISDVMDTGAAVRTLNILLAEERAVAAAILAVD